MLKLNTNLYNQRFFERYYD
eukprot:UN10256